MNEATCSDCRVERVTGKEFPRVILCPRHASVDALYDAAKVVLSNWPANRDGMDYAGPLPAGVRSLRAAIESADKVRGK